MSALPQPKLRQTPLHLEPDDGHELARYPLIRAVYMDRLDQARAILAADPEQINVQQPFAGLTPLHIAIFRQNNEMVRLLTEHSRIEFSRTDNFGRMPTDMLKYVSDASVFETVMYYSTINHENRHPSGER